MHVTGHCYCRKITFEAEADPATATVCHCTDCQEITGSPYRVVARATVFKILTGTPKVWIKTAESGNKRAHAFCPDCGSPIYAGAPDGNLDVVTLRTGTLDQRRELEPKKQIWTRSALPWALDIHALEPHEKG
ncbi:hypothetical protein FHS83_000766 [Rhizomicrobium palustre]|uniref:CENP-V/GFA domain-containing protein n=1 Tax=Rhizomicrobium palustre TaxID=189966 RepID=A0A846MV89_9PROT|nr:GFA family protein [Rhizomicrobium palustre]NIK87448.1 hypothetical protein [Rhizomicrobium palustre]